MNIIEELHALPNIDSTIRSRVLEWLSGDYDCETKEEITQLIRNNSTALIDAFYTTLSFGTAGLRGIMGAGSNRLNIYTIRSATQGLANYLHRCYGTTTPIRVAVGYDNRHNSQKFAENTAQVLAGNRIEVFLFAQLRPTPLVSFACRYHHCHAAIMITASHNPKQYNGYKVYWGDGGQVLPPHDIGIIQEIEKIHDLHQIQMSALNSPTIHLMGEEVDRAYLQAILEYQIDAKKCQADGKKLAILYSNLHGTGITIVPQALACFGFSNLHFVEAQKIPDSDFPTTPSPNPEERQPLEIGIRQLLEEKQDLFIATDPDCDRLAVVVRHHGEAICLTGSQIAAIAVEGLCQVGNQEKNEPAYVKSIVTSDLVRVIVESHNATMFDVLPGFKYIAEKIRVWEEERLQTGVGHQYVFGGEESCGFLLGTAVRDKDAASASCLISEIALYAKLQGKTLVDLLEELYLQYGLYFEGLFTIKFEESRAGREAQAAMMQLVRSHPPKELAGHLIMEIGDCKTGVWEHRETKKMRPMNLPQSDVLIYILDDASKIIIRPSGTEPKTKVYLMLHENVVSNLLSTQMHLHQKAQVFEKEFKDYLDSL